MTTALLVVLVLSVLYLALRVHRLHLAVVELARVVNKPRRRDRAILKQIAALEDDLEHIRDLVKKGVADQNDFIQARNAIGGGPAIGDHTRAETLALTKALVELEATAYRHLATAAAPTPPPLPPRRADALPPPR